MKKTLSILAVLFVFNAFASDEFETVEPLELACKGASNKYEVRVVYDCRMCARAHGDRRVGSMSPASHLQKAFLRESTERFEHELASGEFLVEKVDGQWLFANLKENYLLSCEERKKTTEHLRGSLEKIYAIGGETTGVGLKLLPARPVGAMVELKGATFEVTQKLYSMFGATVGVLGRYETIRGVERGPYKVFVVEKVLEVMIQPQPPVGIEPWL